MRAASLAVVSTLLFASLLFAERGEPCPAGTNPILILGTFHMAGSTQDAVSLDGGDMTTPRRQKEIAELVESLARFKPTKVAIESARNSTYWNDRYALWLAGSYELGTNEIEQIGFRVAKSMKLKELSPVDYPMWMNGLTAIERHTPKPSPVSKSEAAPENEPESPGMREIRAQVAKDEQTLAGSTVGAYLAYLNAPAREAMNHKWDVMWNLAPGDGVALYETTDLAANWYKRNLRIFTNLLEITEPGDRVLLLIGSGHGKILKGFAADHPQYCLVDDARHLPSF